MFGVPVWLGELLEGGDSMCHLCSIHMEGLLGRGLVDQAP